MKSKRFVKILAVIMALALLLVCFAGCDKDKIKIDKNDNGDTSNNNSQNDQNNQNDQGNNGTNSSGSNNSGDQGNGGEGNEVIDNSPFEFALNNDGETYTITGIGSCMDSEITLPSTYKGKRVSEIAGNAFYGCATLTKVSIPSSIEVIGESAFENCGNILEMTLSDGIKEIKLGAFWGCNKLETISLPNSLEKLQNAFPQYGKLQYNEYDHGKYLGNESNPYLVLINTKANDKETYTVNSQTKFLLTEGFGTKLKSIVVPDSVVSIGDYTFQGCAELEQITLGNGIKYIGERAFDTCEKLKSLTLPEGLMTIGNQAFGWCFVLENVSIPSSIVEMGKDPFTRCDSLKYLEYDGAKYLGNSSNPYLVLIEILDKSVTSFDIHSSTRVIYSSAFKEATSLASVNIPDGVVSIGDNAFYNCSALSDIVLPDGLVAIGELAFARCSSLKSIEIPGSASSFGNSIFERCTSLSSVKLNEGLRVIPYGMLQKCAALETVNIPNSVIEIGAYAFSGCGALESVTLGNSVEVIGEAAFRECGIDKISIPDTLVNIRSDVFKYTGVEYTEYDNALYLGNENNPYLILAKAKSEDITSCTVHPKTRFIYHGAFNECKALVDLQIGESVEVIYQQAFYGCSALKEINLPDSVRTVDYESFAWCSSVESITIGAGVRNISFYSFLSTPALSSISVSETNPAYKSSGNCLIKIHSKTLVKGCNTSVVPSDGSVTVIGAYAFYDADELKEINIPLSVAEIQSTVFGYANIFDTINYEGAKKDWYKIKRAADWDFGRTSYVIHATDGDITVNKH